MVGESEQLAERLLASLPDNVLDRLAELIALKLMGKNGGVMPSKQVVAGSSPVSRSTGTKDRLITTCMGLENRYRSKLV